MDPLNLSKYEKPIALTTPKNSKDSNKEFPGESDIVICKSPDA